MDGADFVTEERPDEPQEPNATAPQPGDFLDPHSGQPEEHQPAEPDVPPPSEPAEGVRSRASAQQESEQEDGQDDGPICRICLSGPEAGRLISPCKCKGSMRYVHRECLDQWRRMSANSKSFWQCDQCQYRYSFRRSELANVLSSNISLHLLTAVVFLLLTLFAGYLFKLVMLVAAREEALEGLTPAEAAEVRAAVYKDTDLLQESPRSFWRVDLEHMLGGFVTVCLMGFFTLLSRLGLPNHVFFIRGRGGRRGGGDPSACEAILVAVLLLIGLVRAVTSTYGFVEKMTKRFLARAEYLVENVEPDPPRSS